MPETERTDVRQDRAAHQADVQYDLVQALPRGQPALPP